MNVALCAIGRLENRYAVEFVDYYKNLGVDKIFISDNNYNDEEYFEDVLQPYIDENFVEIIDCRNKEVYQNTSMVIAADIRCITTTVRDTTPEREA